MNEPVSTSSVASDCSPSQPDLMVLEPSQCAKKSNGSEKDSNASGTSRFTMTSKHLMQHNTAASGCSQEALLASQQVSPASAEAIKMTVGSGVRLSGFVKSQNPLGSC